MKLNKLPDRTPVRIAITVSPELHQKLSAFADAYKEEYGEEEKVAELIPFMLGQFLEADRKFRGKARTQATG